LLFWVSFSLLIILLSLTSLCFFYSQSHFFLLLLLQLRALCSQSRYSTIWATPPIHFSLVNLEMGLANYLLRLASNHNPPNLSLPSS
jgi:hypothetical protein